MLSNLGKKHMWFSLSFLHFMHCSIFMRYTKIKLIVFTNLEKKLYKNRGNLGVLVV